MRSSRTPHAHRVCEHESAMSSIRCSHSTSCSSAPPPSTDCSIRAGAVVSPTVATRLLPDKGGRAIAASPTRSLAGGRRNGKKRSWGPGQRHARDLAANTEAGAGCPVGAAARTRERKGAARSGPDESTRREALARAARRRRDAGSAHFALGEGGAVRALLRTAAGRPRQVLSGLDCGRVVGSAYAHLPSTASGTPDPDHLDP